MTSNLLWRMEAWMAAEVSLMAATAEEEGAGEREGGEEEGERG